MQKLSESIFFPTRSRHSAAPVRSFCVLGWKINKRTNVNFVCGIRTAAAHKQRASLCSFVSPRLRMVLHTVCKSVELLKLKHHKHYFNQRGMVKFARINNAIPTRKTPFSIPNCHCEASTLSRLQNRRPHC